MKIRKVLILFFLIGVTLAACTPASVGQNTPAPAVLTPSPAGTAIKPPASATPTGSAPVSSTPTISTPASIPPAGNLPPAAVAAQQALAQELGVRPADVKVVKVESVTWRNGCLGVDMPGRMCTQVITPGYKITLEANGQQYVYHTNETGSAALLASAPLPQTGGKELTWQQTEAGVCSRAEIGLQSVAYGTCDGQLKEAPLPGKRAAELNYFISTYAPFSGTTKAGSVEFNGSGQQQPNQAEMRSIAEWARLVYMEAEGGRGGAAWGLAFTWHREGGIAGFCNDLTVYRDGWALAGSCKGNMQQGGKPYRLSAAELEQMYGWVDQFASFDYEQKDSAVADAMLVRLSLVGTGKQQATPAQQEEIATAAGQMYANATK